MAQFPENKRVKIDVTNELNKNTKLSDLRVADVYGIFRQYKSIVIGAIESCFTHDLHEDYAVLQHRLLAAQAPRRNDLVKYRVVYKSDVPQPKVAKKLGGIVAELRLSPELSLDVKKALQYLEASCIGLAVFSRPNNLSKDMIEWAGDIDPVEYYKSLVESSEQHLKKYPRLASQTSTIPPVPTTDHQPTAVAIPVASKHEPFSDEYLQGQVSNFIVSPNELAGAIPWDQIADYNCDLKKTLLVSYFAAQTIRPEYRRSPPGILLHGDQGTGKISIVKSFAAHKEMVMYKISSSIHGSLRGQSEKLIKFIFDAVRKSAIYKLCILFFDEVDGLLYGSQKESSGFESMIKELWGDLIADKVSCFVFSATNKPWNINMGDYNRRFRLKVHITIPKEGELVQFTQFALAKFWHEVNDQGLRELADVCNGFSPNDIAYEVQDVAVTLFYEASEATRWTEMQKDGKKVLVPATGDDKVVKEGRQMESLDNAEPRPITTNMLLQVFQSGKAKKTCSAELEEKHRAWNAQF